MTTETLETLRDTLSANRIFGEPVECDGAVLVPVGRLRGGGGGGSGPEGEGEGGGFGLVAQATGAFAIQDGEVSWIPAVDHNRRILLGSVLALIGLVILRSVVGHLGAAEH